MSKLTHIVGDSFFTHNSQPGAWTTRVRDSVNSKFHSRGGASNGYIWLTAKNLIQKMEPGQSIIIGWSEQIRPWARCFYNDAEQYNSMRLTYLQEFFEPSLEAARDQGLQRSLVELAHLKGVNLLWMWSFPWTWLGSTQVNLDDRSRKSYSYTDWAASQIRPALFYFSQREISTNDRDQFCRALHQDPRPNHIADLGVHSKIADLVLNWINQPRPGYIDIPD